MGKSGYKQTELGLLPNCWGIESVENMFLKARIGWQGLTTSEYLSFGDYCLVTGTDINGGVVNWKNCFYVEKNRYDQDKNIQLKNGDLLITKDGTIGKVAIVEELKKPATLNSGIFVLREKVFPINSKYLYYVFLSKLFKKFISDLTAGSTIVHLYQKDFVKFKFPYPDIKEQKNIAEALSNIDELISNQEKLIEKKRAIKQGVMQELLTGKKRLDSFKNEWINIKIKQISDVGRGRIISHNEINNSIPLYPVYSSQTSNDGIMGYIETFDFEGEYITWTTDGVNAGTVYYRNGRFNCTNVCGTIKLNRYDAKFISYKLSTVTSKYVSQNLANPKLMNDVMKNIEIRVPGDIKEQKAIANIITDIEKEIFEQEQKLGKYKQLKQAMMEQLLTGKIRLV